MCNKEKERKWGVFQEKSCEKGLCGKLVNLQSLWQKEKKGKKKKTKLWKKKNKKEEEEK